VTDERTSQERELDRLRTENAALRRGLESTAANLQWQQSRCNELTGAIEELTRRKIVEVGMLNTVIKGIVQFLGGSVDIHRTDLESATKLKLQRHNHADGLTISLSDE
jgi:hypothetical protein